ncbi:MAG: hypothetical protein D6812_00130, partial [Deltaproteobacteria bacterium]
MWTGTPARAQQQTEQRILTQAEFARKLVQHLELEEEGIPKDARDEDYFSLLRGGKSVEVEAEIAEKTSLTLVKNAFFESGFWISTLNAIETVSYPVEFPESGIYWLRVQAKGGEQFWQVDDRPTEVVHPAPVFQWLDLRRYVLSRGIHTVKMTIPQEGGTDLFRFSADNLNAGEPTGGFQADKLLTYGALAEILVRQMRVEDRLPVDESYVFKVKIVEKRFATDRNPGIGRFPMKVEDDGVYTIRVAVVGKEPVTFYIKGGRRLVRPTQSRMADAGTVRVASAEPLPRLSQGEGVQLQDITTAFFAAGEHIIEALLPPNTSIEGFRRVKRRATPQDYVDILAKFGLKVGKPDEFVTEEAAEAILEGFLAGVTNPFAKSALPEGPAAPSPEAPTTEGGKPVP